ncbi:winged helix-turn-helix transcriptional regulator [Niastella sp. OAS944]|uniref:winged helix-turn-helix transcriptional regulator n=1 Tax=Niastella sp. OAS944 TaxID=2664089 RepID=UPI003474124B|nr:DNA-binding HxlR family transcriptional regulator [Chitinophagaceae bacterium OAS944]
MYEKKIPKSFDCGMSILMEIIGGKWKTYLIHLINNGKIRPNELQKAIPSANRRVLDLQLRELEFHGIVERTIYPELPPRVEYRLTKFGKTMLPLLEAMDKWGESYLDEFEQLMKQKESELSNQN